MSPIPGGTDPLKRWPRRLLDGWHVPALLFHTRPLTHRLTHDRFTANRSHHHHSVSGTYRPARLPRGGNAPPRFQPLQLSSLAQVRLVGSRSQLRGQPRGSRSGSPRLLALRNRPTDRGSRPRCGRLLLANYSWVRRESFELPASASDRRIITTAKAALGLTGTRCRRFDHGEGFELRPVGSCTVAFVSPSY